MSPDPSEIRTATVEEIEARSHFFRRNMNQRRARIGATLVMTAFPAAVAGGLFKLAARRDLYPDERLASGAVGALALGLALSVPIIYYLGDSDISPHRVSNPSSHKPREASLET